MATKTKKYQATRVLLYVVAFVSAFYYGAHLVIPAQMLRLSDLGVPSLLASCSARKAEMKIWTVLASGSLVVILSLACMLPIKHYIS